MSFSSFFRSFTNMKCQNRYICLSRCLISHITVFLAILLLYPVVANAQNWSALNDDQRLILAPLEEDWSSLTAPRQKKWVEVANRYPSMSDTEQSTLQSRMAQWAELSTKQRQRARDNYLRTLKISPEKKAAAWESYQQLSDEDKKLLAQKRAQTSKPSAVTSPTLK
ncbi:DUF3106 domain-containing protein [Polynucleobacter sp. MWH-CaK5]|jgi:hypothetical protein|uniref:DUF3106 domain-containing protein n=1 Tax=Polynucleobacter sp. MWH-CaK5 TaxID=2689107 RepID=UPI001BFD7464|nr:DUF3106 domain-containing protein [Polynucleobacter sp. MWH-CaK5]QWD88529.1 DUF3106 domain-containing protein [Polynucleobacter sp. MWH-CaK5]